MFKLVLCAFFAVAAAEPGLLTAPLTYSAGIAPLAYSGPYAPATTYISPASSIIQPAIYPTSYSYPHFIKKRSAAFAYNGYIAPSTYLAPTPLATTYTTPYVASAGILPAASIAYSTPAHFIKKRSAPIALNTIAYSAPVSYYPTTYPTTYSAPLYTTPYISNAHLAYPTHLIKKRSVALAYAAPAAVSHQSRVDYTGPVVSSYAAVGPINYPYYSPAVHYAK